MKSPMEFCFRLFLLVFVLPLLLCIAAPFLIYKKIVILLVKYKNKSCKSDNQLIPMEMADYIFLSPHPMNVEEVSTLMYERLILVFEGTMTLEKLQSIIWDDVLLKGDSKLLFAPVSKYGHWFWQDFKLHFNVKDHVHYMEGFENRTTAMSDTEVLDRCRHMQISLKDKPLWKINFIPGFVYTEETFSNTNDHWAITIYVHHMYGDLTSIFGKFIKEPSKKFSKNIPVSDKRSRFIHAFATLWAVTRLFTESILLAWKKTDNIFHGEQLSEKFHTCITKRFPIRIIEDIRKSQKTRVTAILWTALAESFSARQSEMAGNCLSNEVVLTFSAQRSVAKGVGSRNIDLVNNATIWMASLPVRTMDVLKRLQLIDNIYQNLICYQMMCASVLEFSFSVFPQFIRDWFTTYEHNAIFPATFFGTNIIGPPDGMIFENNVPKDYFAFTLLQKGVGVGPVLISCGDYARLLITIDDVIMKNKSDVQQFVNSWLDSLYDIHKRSIS